MSEAKFIDSEVKVSELPHSPKNLDWGATEATVYHAMISHDPEGRPPSEIWKSDLKEMNSKEIETKQKNFLEKVLGKYGHVSCGYQANVGLFYKVPRHTTMFLCSFDQSKYLQQSMRYTRAENFIANMRGEEAEEIFLKQKKIYEDLIEEDVPREDARFVLPLASASNIHQNTNFIGLANISRVLSSENSKVPSTSKKILKKSLEKLKLEEPELFRQALIDRYNEIRRGYPVANIFSESNDWVNQVKNSLGSKDLVRFKSKIDSDLIKESRGFNDQALSFLNLSNQIDSVEGYITEMSLSAWHQFMRQDTVKQSVESIYDAAERGEIVIPEKISESSLEGDYLDLCKESLEFYKEKKSEVSEEKAIEIVPHGLSIYVAFSLDGFNSISGFIEDRTSEDSQWEIRKTANKIKKMMEKENPEFKNM